MARTLLSMDSFALLHVDTPRSTSQGISTLTVRHRLEAGCDIQYHVREYCSIIPPPILIVPHKLQLGRHYMTVQLSNGCQRRQAHTEHHLESRSMHVFFSFFQKMEKKSWSSPVILSTMRICYFTYSSEFAKYCAKNHSAVYSMYFVKRALLKIVCHKRHSEEYLNGRLCLRPHHLEFMMPLHCGLTEMMTSIPRSTENV